jgi:hypothetical protein
LNGASFRTMMSCTMVNAGPRISQSKPWLISMRRCPNRCQPSLFCLGYWRGSPQRAARQSQDRSHVCGRGRRPFRRNSSGQRCSSLE